MVTAFLSLVTIAAILFCLSAGGSSFFRYSAFAFVIIAALLSLWEKEETSETTEFLEKYIEILSNLKCPSSSSLLHFQNLVSLVLKRQASEIKKLEKEKKDEEALNARQEFRENYSLFSTFDLTPPGGWKIFFKDDLAPTSKEV
jgi:Tfp pilus assembly protein PilN